MLFGAELHAQHEQKNTLSMQTSFVANQWHQCFGFLFRRLPSRFCCSACLAAFICAAICACAREFHGSLRQEETDGQMQSKTSALGT